MISIEQFLCVLCAAGAPPPVLKKVLSQATRGRYGRTGRPIDLLCNHFAVKVTNMADVYHYNVTYLADRLLMSFAIHS
jgi:hypothetical protein